MLEKAKALVSHIRAYKSLLKKVCITFKTEIHFK